MLPSNNTITDIAHPIDQAQRQTNYLILRTLEQKLDPALFTNLLTQVAKQMDLPEHTAWDGKRLPCSYLQLKESQATSDSHLLSDLVMNLGQKNIDNFDESTSPTISTHLKSQFSISNSQNLYSQFHWQLAKPKDTLRKIGSNCAFSKFDRVKTVFCHTDFTTDEVSAIYNVYFDQKGSFIVSAGDEGIIKVWDRDTLTLQASLHGHDDYITEIDISKCNRFIASAGKDAQIIIWELATGKLLYRLSHHTKLINCVKFFTPKPPTNQNAPQQQYLFSASDDGTVRLYDLTPISAWAQCKQQKQDSQTARTSEEDQYRVRRSSRQQRVSSAGTTEDHEELFSIELTPDEFRPGTRNKKLDTLVMNHQGLVIAGSSSCELLVWRLNYDLISKRIPKQDCYKFLGQFKMSRQSCVKFCEFNPKNGVLGVGDTLMTGSGDGVINLWNMSVGQWRSQKENSFNLEDKSRLLLTIDEGRGCRKTREVKIVDPDGHEQIEYILEDIQQEGIQFKEIANFSKSVCDCVRWSCNGRFAIASVQCQIEGEENDFCRVKIWDTVELSFIEDLSRMSGIRLPKNTFVLEAHPSQEEILVTGSDTGVLALWNLHTKQLLKQFKQYGVYSVDANIMDNPLHGSWSRDGNAYISGNSLGTISLYSIEDVHHQYEATRVQQFFQFDIQRQPENPFEKITEKPTICGYNMMPYEVQPERLRIRFTELDPNFNSARFQRNLVVAKELGNMEERYYQDKLQSSLFDDGVNANLQPMDSIQVSSIQPAIYDAGDVDMSDIQIVEQLQDNLQQQRQDARRPRLQRNNQRITSSEVPSDEASSNSDVDMNSSSSDPEEKEDSEHRMNTRRRDRGRNHVISRTQFTESHRLQRPQRAARPANLRDTETVGNESSLPRLINNRATRNRARRISSSSSDEDQQSDDSQAQRNQNTNLHHQTGSGSSNRRRNVDQSSPEQIQSASRSAKTRRGLQQTEDYQPNEDAQRGNFYLSDHDLTNEPDDKQDYSSHMLIAATKLQSHKMEHNYELIKSSLPQQPMPCNLCKRIDGEIVGPFGHSKKSQIWLHKECIEINSYSYFSVTHKKWVNIDTMMKQLMEDAQYCCYRCEKFGASVSCITCGKNFHGYFCAGVYLIPSATGIGAKGGEGTNSQFWQCLFCKNQENYETTLSLAEINPPSKDQRPYLQALKKIDKAHLISDQNHLTREIQSQHAITYMPQIDDVLLYFFQGHEDYVYQYNCHFYAGQQSPFPKRQTMPWFSSQTKKQVTSEPTCLCKVVSITTLFPSQRSLRLISHYGADASEMTQVPQMIQRVELEFISNHHEKFFIDIFQNELPDFLVLYQIFLPQQAHYTQESLVGKEVTVRLKSKTQRVKIIEDSPAEPNFSPQSLWQTLLCAPVQQIDFNQRRQVQPEIEQNFRVSFWDIVFPEAQKVDLHGFKEHEFAKLKSYLQTYMQKNKEYLIYFKERVHEKIAFEYRQIIPQEMWFDLLYSRLQNKYYRSSRQFFEDLQLIASNAAAYNGEKHEVAVDALELVRKCKFEAVRFIDQNGDRQVRERVQEASGKLDSQYQQQRPQNINLLRDIQPRRNVIQINTMVAPVEIDFEESKDEILPQKGKRLRRVQDSPEVEMMLEQGERTLRKRQRQM